MSTVWVRPFSPIGATVSLSATQASGRVALTLVQGAMTSVRVYNAGTNTVFLNFGDSTVTAATTNMPVPSGSVEVLRVPQGCTHIAGICATGETATVYFTSGDGA